MNPVVSNLNIFKVLKSSFPFCADFTKQHWIIVVLFISNAVMMAIVFKNHTSPSDFMGTMISPTAILLFIFEIILGFFLCVYAIRMAVVSLDPSIQLSNKSLLNSVWQIFCMTLLVGITSIPFYLFLVIPGIWWSTKTCLAFVNILATDDGQIQSIKKSFQLMDNRFWLCFGYLAGILTLPMIGIAILAILGSLCLHMSLLPDWDVESINRAIQSIAAIFINVIYCFCQSWLYVYLKSNNSNAQVVA